MSTPAPNHREARLEGVRFRHVHRYFGSRRELAGTICTRALSAGQVRITMVLVHPIDAHPPKLTYEQRVLAAALETLTAFGPGFLPANYPIPVQRKPVCISREEGRQRAWDRLHDDRMCVITTVDSMKSLLSGDMLVPTLARVLHFPLDSTVNVK